MEGSEVVLWIASKPTATIKMVAARYVVVKFRAGKGATSLPQTHIFAELACAIFSTICSNVTDPHTSLMTNFAYRFEGPHHACWRR